MLSADSAATHAAQEIIDRFRLPASIRSSQIKHPASTIPNKPMAICIGGHGFFGRAVQCRGDLALHFLEQRVGHIPSPLVLLRRYVLAIPPDGDDRRPLRPVAGQRLRSRLCCTVLRSRTVTMAERRGPWSLAGAGAFVLGCASPV